MRSRTALRRMHQTQRQFLANIVHELGRPLGAVGSAIQALREGADEDHDFRQELLAGIDEEVVRLARLLDDLSHLYSQVEATWKLHFQHIALAPLAAPSAGPSPPACGRQGRPLAGGGTWPRCRRLDIDPDRLGQALDNLVSNAIKYTPTGGTVTVSAGVKMGSMWICVRDTGRGIPPADQEHIFTPFYRGQEDQRFPEGMGLGLPIARDLIAAHNGRLEIESSSGGSSFTIWLPLMADPG